MIKKILFLLIILIPAVGADSFYAISDNKIFSNDFKIILTENITSNILIDNQSIYYFTHNKLFSNNKILGYENYNLTISGIKEISLSDKNIFVKKDFEILTINKTSGELLQRNIYSYYIDKTFTFISNSISSFYINVFGYSQLSDGVTLIAGENINLTQDTQNKTITVTGAATWSLSMINSSEINVDNIFVSGGVFNPQNESYEMGWQYSINNLWMYLYKKANEKITAVVYSENLIYFYNCYYGAVDCYTHELEIGDGSVSVNGDFFVNSKNIETELIKTSTKSFQADIINVSGIYSDIIIIPQNMNLTNITVIIEPVTNTTNHTLNFTIERYINYPNTKEIILTTSNNLNINYINSLEYSFNNNDILLLNYTSYTNVTKSSSMFKFKVR